MSNSLFSSIESKHDKQISKVVSIQQNNVKEVKNYGLGNEVNVEINSLAIIPIIADKIYKEPFSAIRELYNNEVTACQKALDIDPKLDQKIDIILNTDTRELTIQGFNSLGLDSYTFNKILRVMGNSGNSEGKQKGFFGIGFFSFFKLSERIIIISKSLESQEEFAYICKSALKFERLGKENYDELEKTGFKIIINIKDEVNLRDVDLYIEKITKLSGIKTNYIKDGDEIQLTQYDSLMDYFKSTYSAFFEDPLSCNYSLYYEHYDHEDFELIIGKIAQEKRSENTPDIIKENYLLNTPINIDNIFNYDTIKLLNIKSERTYNPTPDRERLDQESEDKLNSVLSEDKYNLSNHNIDNYTLPETIQEWYNLPLRWFVHNVGKREDKKYLRLSQDVKSLNYKNYNGQHKFNDLADQLPIIKPSSFGYCLSFRKKKFEELRDDDKFCINPKSKSIENLALLEAIGFKNIVKQTNRKNSGSSNRTYNFRYTNNFKYHYYGYVRDDPVENSVIIRSENLNDDKVYLRYLHNNDQVCFVSPTANEPFAINFKDLHENFDDEILWTNRGLMSVKDILKGIKHRKVTRYTNDNLRTKTLLNLDGFIFVCNNRTLLGKLTMYINKYYYKSSLKNDTIKEPYYQEIEAKLTDKLPALLRYFNHSIRSYDFDSNDFEMWNDMIEESMEVKV